MATVALVSTATPSVDGRGRRLGTARSRAGGGPLPESVATPTAGCAHPRNAGLPLCPGGPRRGARGLCSWDSAPALTGTRRRCIERLHIFYRCRRFLSMPALPARTRSTRGGNVNNPPAGAAREPDVSDHEICAAWSALRADRDPRAGRCNLRRQFPRPGSRQPLEVTGVGPGGSERINGCRRGAHGVDHLRSPPDIGPEQGNGKHTGNPGPSDAGGQGRGGHA